MCPNPVTGYDVTACSANPTSARSSEKFLSRVLMNAVSRVPAVENHKKGGRVMFKGGYRV